MITVRWFPLNSARNSLLGSGGLCPEAPAPLEGLEGFLEAEYGERRLEPWRFLRYDSGFALLRGKSLLVYVRVGPLELGIEEEDMEEQHVATEPQHSLEGAVPVLAFSSYLWQEALYLRSGLPAAHSEASGSPPPSAPQALPCRSVYRRLEKR